MPRLIRPVTRMKLIQHVGKMREVARAFHRFTQGNVADLMRPAAN